MSTPNLLDLRIPLNLKLTNEDFNANMETDISKTKFHIYLGKQANYTFYIKTFNQHINPISKNRNEWLSS